VDRASLRRKRLQRVEGCSAPWPLQDKDDTVNGGVFATLTICRWLFVREVEDQLGDPIKFRKEFVAQISRTLKWSGLKVTQG
jgi:hypothetical protein